MCKIVYVLPSFITSSAARSFGHKDLESLLVEARTRNVQEKITGILLYKNGHFLQLLEGDEENVRRIYEKITHDVRHTNVTTVVENEMNERVFPSWSMGVL